MSTLSNQINVFFNHFLRFQMRRKWQQLGGGPVSILSNNCLAGLIYHDLGLRFDSPTINLCMPLPYFITFMENLGDALKADITEVPNTGRPYPVGKIVVGATREEIPLHFMHYPSFHEAVDLWRKRCTRVDYSRIVIIAAENAPCTNDELKRFSALPFPKLLLCQSERTLEVLGCNAFYVKSDSKKTLNMTDFCGYFGRRFYHQIDVPKTMLRLSCRTILDDRLNKALPLLFPRVFARKVPCIHRY